LIAQFDAHPTRSEGGSTLAKVPYEVTLRFHDIENLIVRDFGYQNSQASSQVTARPSPPQALSISPLLCAKM
jgi:hypothetical protein